MYSKREAKLIEPYLTSGASVLEYGSGESTFEVAAKVKLLITVEHQLEWFNKIKAKLPKNTVILFEPPTCLKWGTDGTYEQFKNYIEAPKGIFNVIIIDGRARVGCAKYCKNVANENTIIFVHDYQREEYKEIETHLQLIEVVETMAKFKLK
jgi:hypothetical protein